MRNIYCISIIVEAQDCAQFMLSFELILLVLLRRISLPFICGMHYKCFVVIRAPYIHVDACMRFFRLEAFAVVQIWTSPKIKGFTRALIFIWCAHTSHTHAYVQTNNFQSGVKLLTCLNWIMRKGCTAFWECWGRLYFVGCAIVDVFVCEFCFLEFYHSREIGLTRNTYLNTFQRNGSMVVCVFSIYYSYTWTKTILFLNLCNDK